MSVDESHANRIFISWSGEKSKAIALLLRDWLRGLIQSSSPWISEEDIKKGSPWNKSLRDALDTSYAGIVCLTKENIDSLWMSFEAGYLSKSVENEQRVTPILVDVSRTELPSVYSQMQYATLNQSDMWKMISSLNDCGERLLVEQDRLKSAFNNAYPKFEQDVQEVLSTFIDAPEYADATSPEIDSNKALTEILDVVRSLSRESHRADSGIAPSLWRGEMGVRRFEEGDKVEHDRYGQGTVVSAWRDQYNDSPHDIVTIWFPEHGKFEFNLGEASESMRWIPTADNLNDVPF